MKNNKIIKNIVNEIIDKIQSCNLELNKIYEFNLGNMSHCNMSHEEMINHYKNNSSPLSFLIEKYPISAINLGSPFSSVKRSLL